MSIALKITAAWRLSASWHMQPRWLARLFLGWFLNPENYLEHTRW